MSIIFLENFNTVHDVIEYNCQTNVVSDIDDLPQGANLARGFFLREGRQICGVHASKAGPVFFWDGGTINLAEEDVEIVIKPADKGGKVATVLVNGAEAMTMRYVIGPTDPFGFDPDDFADFFTWLSNSLERESTYEYYTVPPNTHPDVIDDIKK